MSLRPSVGTAVLVAAGAVLLFGTMAAAAGTDVLINGDVPGSVQNEIRITQNPTNAANLVVAYNDKVGTGSSPLGVSHTTDTGASWTDTQLGVPLDPLFLMPMPRIFDPFIDSESGGTIYAGYIAADTTVNGASGIYIESSGDGGATWSGPTTIDFDTAAVGPGDAAYRFNDRADMTVDGADDLHVVWIKDVGVGMSTSDIYYAKSPPPGPPGPGNPTGLDFTGVGPGSVAPKIVNDFSGVDEGNAPDVAVAPDGTVYVAWIDVNVLVTTPQPATLLIDKSLDGGVTFGPDNVVAGITALPKFVSTAGGSNDDARSGSYPVIAVDPANSQTVYLAYAADPGGGDEADIFFIKSLDGGATWSGPITVNDDATTNDQIHPAIAVRPGGIIDLAWYDKRNAVNDDQWDVYVANSSDGGATFGPNRRITDQSFATPTDLGGSPWIGEYLGIEVTAGASYLAFTSGINDSKGDVFFDLETGLADLSLTKSVDDPTPDAGDDVVFTLMVTNAGPTAASGVAVTDVVPSGYTYVSDDAGGAYVPGTGVWTVGALGAGNSATLAITATVNLSGDYLNTAEVTAVNEPDPDSTPANDDGDQSEDDEAAAATTPVVPTCNGLAATHLGTTGDDVITGGPTDDVIVARAGDDTIDGGGGNDTICADAGDDTIDGGPGNDWIDGGPGEDTATYLTSPAAVNVDLGSGTASGGAGADSLTAVRHLIGSPFDDKLAGNAFGNQIEGLAGDDKIKGKRGDDTLLGGPGDDVLQGRQDDDTLIGGPGSDTASYFVATNPVAVNLILGTASGDGNDTLASIENASGSKQDDALLGNGQANLLIGFKGDDVLDGRGGADTLRGKPGDDDLFGGNGDDRLLGGAGTDSAFGGLGTNDFCVAETKTDCEKP